MALAPRPQVLVADEPTASLDPSVQVAVLDLIDARRARGAGLAVLLISHDLGSVARHRRARGGDVRRADRGGGAGPRGAGGPAAPLHGRAARPRAASGRARAARVPIPGAPPVPGSPAAGCAFAPRCAGGAGRVRGAAPRLGPAGPGRRVACVLTHREAAAIGRGAGR